MISLLSLVAQSFTRRSVSVRLSSTMTAVCSNITETKFERLPDVAKPKHYNINLVPDLQKFSFTGKVSIDAEISKETDYLKLHAQELDIKSVNLTLSSGKELPKLPTKYDEKLNILTVVLPSKINPQDIKLNIEYAGSLNDKMRGFYRSNYKATDGSTKYLASTQFESTYARFAFPCWDEPIYKATFDVSLTVPEIMTALSNNEVIATKSDGGYKTVTFATTPYMSTYLVAFAVGELEYVEAQTKGGVKMRVYTVPGKKSQGEWSLDLATKAVDWYGEWFGIPYALPKCDLIAIPDFSMGAMENWGLVTFREVALLVDPTKSSTKQRSHVALIVAHELAHLWFGDLVTMKWWTDLWLKEGFASFMEYMFVGYNYPEFAIWKHFVNDEWARGLNLDAMKSSHPIEVTIDNPNELDEIYDSITYAKSNSVNRMLSSYLSEEVFQKGLRIYLDRFKYSNAVTVDLWDALSVASGQNVNELMSGWTKQMGFPIVKVSEKKEGNKRLVTLSQERFIADGSKDTESSMWQVPVNICTSSDPEKCAHRVLLTKKEDTFTLEGVQEGDWIKINAGTAGFYRVSYTPEMLKPLLEAISTRKMGVLDRFGMANDMLAMMSSGACSVADMLSLYSACAKGGEEEFIVWSCLDEALSTIYSALIQKDNSKETIHKLNAFVSSSLAPLGDVFGWQAQKGEDPQRGMVRALVLGRLCKSDHAPAIEKAKQIFDDHIKNNTPMDPDMRLAIFGSIIRNGAANEFNQLMEMFEKCGFGEVERHCLVALGQTSDPELLQKLFDYAVTQGKVRPQDLLMVWIGSRNSSTGLALLWPFFQKNLRVLMEKFGGANSSLFLHSLKMCTNNYADDAVIGKIQSTLCSELSPNDLHTLSRPIRQINEQIQLNADLKKRMALIDEFLGKK